MNRTKIEWTDYTWNPVTGCWGPGGTAAAPNRCPYCYAVKVHARFQDKNYNDPQPRKWGYSFAPTFHPERLSQPAKVKNSSKIFVCSMADLFGDWVPAEWIIEVLRVVRENPHHIFQFLTKNSKRLQDWYWPPNAWVGTTVTNQADADERLHWLSKVEAPVLFVSHEPLLGEIDMRGKIVEFLRDGSSYFSAIPRSTPHQLVNWAIIGAQTGPGAVKPDPAWVQGLVEQCRAAAVPCFLKNNLNWKEKIQEWPLETGESPPHA